MDYSLNPNISIDQTLNPYSVDDTPLGLAITEEQCIAQFILLCAGAELTEREKEHHRQDQQPCLIVLQSTADRQTRLSALAKGSLAAWDPNTIDTTNHSTALIKTALRGCKECTAFLLKDPRTNPNIQDSDGRTALHYAVTLSSSGIQLSSYLLNQQRTNIMLKDRDGKTPRDMLNILSVTQASHRLQILKLFDLRKMRVYTYLSLKKARCSEQCTDQQCFHNAHLPADLRLKITRLLTIESLPLKTVIIAPQPGLLSRVYSLFQAYCGAQQEKS